MKTKNLIILLLLIFVLVNTAKADETKTTLQFENSIEVTIIENQFAPNKADIKMCQGGKVVCLIDGAVPFGSAGSMPKTYVKSITLKVEDKSYNLDTSNMYNAWGKRPKEIPGIIKYMAVHCYSSDFCTLRGLFGDAAGSYVGEWSIGNGTPVRTILTGQNDVINLFMQHIDPPVFD